MGISAFCVDASIHQACAHTTNNAGDTRALLSQLQNAPSDQHPLILENLSRVCDDACRPFIADALRSDQPDTLIAAIHAAAALSDPKLSPPLSDLVRNHPSDNIRLEALNALTQIGQPHTFHALLATVNPHHPDEIQKRILRSLPQNLIHNYAQKYAILSAFSPFVTSTAHAYQRHPEILFNAILPLLQNDSPQQRTQHLRTLSLLSPHLSDTNVLLPNAFDILSAQPNNCLDTVSLILAPLPDTHAALFILAHFPKLDPATQLQLLHTLHPSTAPLLVDALLQSHEIKKNILSSQALTRAILKAAAPAPTHAAKAFALNVLNAHLTQHLPDALRVLSADAHLPDIQNRILPYLHHNNPAVAAAAFNAITQNPRVFDALLERIAQTPDLDRNSPAFAARYALFILAATFPQQIPDDSKKKAIELSLNVLKTPENLHAEPALLLLIALDYPLSLPSPSQRAALRPALQSLFLKTAALNPTPDALDFLRLSLSHRDESLSAAAFDTLSFVPNAFHLIPEKTWLPIFKNAIASNDIRAHHAMIAAARLNLKILIPDIEKRLTDTNTYIAYNALWALQKLHTLPPQHRLSALYYRTPHGLLRDRLGFLTALSHHPIENLDARELISNTPIHPGDIIRPLANDTPQPNHVVFCLLEDQSLHIVKTDRFGIVRVPARHTNPKN